MLLELALIAPALAPDLAMGAPWTTLQLLPNADLLDRAEKSRLGNAATVVSAVEAAIVGEDGITEMETVQRK